MSDTQSAGSDRQVSVLTLAGLGLVVAGTLLPAISHYGRDAYTGSVRYFDAWRVPAYLLFATTAIGLYLCGARRFDLLWYPALAIIALVGGPLVITIFNDFESRAWAKYIVLAEPGLRWPGQYPAWPGWLALVAGAVSLATAAWLVRPPRTQRVLALAGVGLLAAGSYLPMQLGRAHAVNFWFFPTGLVLVISAVLALIIVAVGQYRWLWIVVFASIMGTALPLAEVSGMVRSHRTKLEQARSAVLEGRAIEAKQAEHNDQGKELTDAEKLLRRQKFDRETQKWLSGTEASFAPASPGHLYPLGIVVVFAGIVLLGVVASMGSQAPAAVPKPNASGYR